MLCGAQECNTLATANEAEYNATTLSQAMNSRSLRDGGQKLESTGLFLSQQEENNKQTNKKKQNETKQVRVMFFCCSNTGAK